MNYAGIIYNDFTSGDGVSVSFFFQGCDRHCKGCHNPETWDFEGGKPFTNKVIDDVIAGLHANGVSRNLALMGGEPLHQKNRGILIGLLYAVRKQSPETPIYIWTGYTLEELVEKDIPSIDIILQSIDYLIDGPYIEELKDTTLKWRGSSNQRIFDKSQIISYYRKKREAGEK